MGRRRTAWRLLLVLSLSGCAVNDWGLVRVRRLENDTATLLRLETWGAHVVTGAHDAGLTLGYSCRTYVFSRSSGPPAVSLSDLVNPDSDRRHLRPVSCNPCPRLAELGTPLLRAGRTVGISLDANRNRVGVAVGLQQRATLELPADGTVVYLEYDSANEDSTAITVGKEIRR